MSSATDESNEKRPTDGFKYALLPLEQTDQKQPLLWFQYTIRDDKTRKYSRRIVQAESQELVERMHPNSTIEAIERALVFTSADMAAAADVAQQQQQKAPEKQPEVWLWTVSAYAMNNGKQRCVVWSDTREAAEYAARHIVFREYVTDPDHHIWNVKIGTSNEQLTEYIVLKKELGSIYESGRTIDQELANIDGELERLMKQRVRIMKQHAQILRQLNECKTRCVAYQPLTHAESEALTASLKLALQLLHRS